MNVFKNMSILTTLVFLALVGKAQVAGQTLTIKFKDIGSYDYNGGKAYMEGDSVRLICDIIGTLQADHKVVYTKDGVKLTSNQEVLVPNTDNHFIPVHTVTTPTQQKYELNIYDISKEDQGSYHCQVETSTGVVVSNAQFSQLAGDYPEITVLYLPDENRYPECTIEEGTIDVKLGSSITLKCTSEVGNPSVSLSWKRSSDGGGNNLEDVTSEIIMSVTEDEIQNVAEPITVTADYNDNIFYCFMTPSKDFFPDGLRSCQVGPLNVINDLGVTLPTITPLVQNAMPGDTVIFQCALMGQSDAVFEWYWEPNWVFEKNPVNPADTKTFALRNVQSYHHMTKVFCKTTSQGVEVRVYGLIRVSGPYEEAPVTPRPPIREQTDNPSGGDSGRTDVGGDGIDGTNGGSDGNNNGGVNPTSATGSRGGGGTTVSSGNGIMIQGAGVKLALTCLLVISILFVGNF